MARTRNGLGARLHVRGSTARWVAQTTTWSGSVGGQWWSGFPVRTLDRLIAGASRYRRIGAEVISEQGAHAVSTLAAIAYPDLGTAERAGDELIRHRDGSRVFRVDGT